jgi:hypothetical protein
MNSIPYRKQSIFLARSDEKSKMWKIWAFSNEPFVLQTCEGSNSGIPQLGRWEGEENSISLSSLFAQKVMLHKLPINSHQFLIFA